MPGPRGILHVREGDSGVQTNRSHLAAANLFQVADDAVDENGEAAIQALVRFVRHEVVAEGRYLRVPGRQTVGDLDLADLDGFPVG